MTHESCIPEAPCGTCRWSHQRASSFQLFTAFITSGACESWNFLNLGAFCSLLNLLKLFLQSVMLHFGGSSYPALYTTAFHLYPWLYLNAFNKVGRECSQMQVFRISLGMVPVSISSKLMLKLLIIDSWCYFCLTFCCLSLVCHIESS